MPRRRPPPEPFVLDRSIEIDVPVERLYRFHLDTRNAPIVAPVDARILDVDGSFPVVEGGEVRLSIRARPLPRPLRWRLRIDAVVPDRAVIGVGLEAPPFTAWRHEHRFESLGRDRSLLRDRMTYRLPGGPMAGLANRMIVARRLAGAVEGRHRNTKTYLERRR